MVCKYHTYTCTVVVINDDSNMNNTSMKELTFPDCKKRFFSKGDSIVSANYTLITVTS